MVIIMGIVCRMGLGDLLAYVGGGGGGGARLFRVYSTRMMELLGPVIKSREDYASMPSDWSFDAKIASCLYTAKSILLPFLKLILCMLPT